MNAGSDISIGGSYGGAIYANTMFCDSKTLSIYTDTSWAKTNINCGDVTCNNITIKPSWILILILQQDKI